MDVISCTEDRWLSFSTSKINILNYKKEYIKDKNPILLAYIEGDFSIMLSGKQILQIEYMNILELCVQLNRWINNPEHTFIYDSISSEEKDILVFNVVDEKQCIILSSWSSNESYIVPFKNLRRAIRDYLDKVNTILDVSYKIQIEDFVE